MVHTVSQWFRGKFDRCVLRRRNVEGSAVIETVIVLAVIVAIALIFNQQIRDFASRLFDMVFNDNSILDALKP